MTLARVRTQPGHFGDWETLPELPYRPVGDPALVIGASGLIEVYVRGADSGVWTLAQPRDKGWSWGGTWQKVGGARLAGDPLVLRHHDDRLELFGAASRAGSGTRGKSARGDLGPLGNCTARWTTSSLETQTSVVTAT